MSFSVLLGFAVRPFAVLLVRFSRPLLSGGGFRLGLTLHLGNPARDPLH